MKYILLENICQKDWKCGLEMWHLTEVTMVYHKFLVLYALPVNNGKYATAYLNVLHRETVGRGCSHAGNLLA